MSKKQHPADGAAIARAILPEVMLPEDIATVLNMSPEEALREVLAGHLGPFSRLGTRLLLRRESFLAALRSREISREASTPGDSR